MNKPNFFILGSAKSGTTSLYYYLKQHPSIFLSEIKEPTFFCENFQVIKNPITYFELFDNVTNEKCIGEASHTYMSDPKSPKILKTLFPNAKFILILRNPAERAYSLYNHMRRHGFEKVSSFRKALNIEDKRFSSAKFKDNNPQSFWNFMYFHSGLYGEQLERYFSLFNKKQFYILTLDELSKNFDNKIKEIFEFLDVDKTYKIEPIIYNKGYKKRFFYKKIIKPLEPDIKIELMKKYQEDQKLLFNLCGINFE